MARFPDGVCRLSEVIGEYVSRHYERLDTESQTVKKGLQGLMTVRTATSEELAAREMLARNRAYVSLFEALLEKFGAEEEALVYQLLFRLSIARSETSMILWRACGANHSGGMRLDSATESEPP